MPSRWGSVRQQEDPVPLDTIPPGRPAGGDTEVRSAYHAKLEPTAAQNWRTSVNDPAGGLRGARRVCPWPWPRPPPRWSLWPAKGGSQPPFAAERGLGKVLGAAPPLAQRRLRRRPFSAFRPPGRR